MRMQLAYSTVPALLMRTETWLTRACSSSIEPSALSMAESRLTRVCSAQRDMLYSAHDGGDEADTCEASIACSDERKSWEEGRHYLIKENIVLD